MAFSHQFDTEHAQKYGVNEAIFIHNLTFWLIKNRANNTNQFEDRTWSYNTYNALTIIFPYWTFKQIRTIVKSLIKQEVIITRHKPGKGQNKGLYYSFTDQSIFMPDLPHKTKSPCPNGQTPCPNGQTSPIYTDSKQDISDISKKDKKKKGKEMGVNITSYIVDDCRYLKNISDQTCTYCATKVLKTDNGTFKMCDKHYRECISQESFEMLGYTYNIIKEGAQCQNSQPSFQNPPHSLEPR